MQLERVSVYTRDQLNRGELVIVLDKSNRKWLLVEYESDGHIYEGWILRKYTLTLHR